MSFVYAKKQRSYDKISEEINIYSDTKITLENWAGYGEKNASMIEKYGMLKTIMINNECCVSFAGNQIKYAEDLFKKLVERGGFEYEELLEDAHEIQSNAPKNAIEFIICYVDKDGSNKLVSIKDGMEPRFCDSEWLGSKMAFEKFQEIRLKHLGGNIKEQMQSELNYFIKAVQECGDDSVGKFIVHMRLKDRTCEYPWRIETGNGYQTIASEERVKLFGDAEEGFYTQEYMQEGMDLAIKIEQIDRLIFFTNRYAYPGYSANNGIGFFKIPILIKDSDKTIV